MSYSTIELKIKQNDIIKSTEFHNYVVDHDRCISLENNEIKLFVIKIDKNTGNDVDAGTISLKLNEINYPNKKLAILGLLNQLSDNELKVLYNSIKCDYAIDDIKE